MRYVLILLCSLSCFGQDFEELATVKKAAVASSSFTPDLLWWKLNEGSGTALTGSATGGGDGGTTDADWVTGKSGSGYALAFNGSSDDATTSAALAFNTNIITLSYWLWSSNTSNTRPLCTGGAGGGSNTFFVVSNGGQHGYYDYGTTGYRREDYTIPTTNEWHHHLVVIDQTAGSGAGDVTVYIDGATTSTTVWSNTKTGTANFATTNLWIGSLAGATFWSGRFDDVRIYSGNQSASRTNIMNDPQ